MVSDVIISIGTDNFRDLVDSWKVDSDQTIIREVKMSITLRHFIPIGFTHTYHHQ